MSEQKSNPIYLILVLQKPELIMHSKKPKLHWSYFFLNSWWLCDCELTYNFSYLVDFSNSYYLGLRNFGLGLTLGPRFFLKSFIFIICTDNRRFSTSKRWLGSRKKNDHGLTRFGFWPEPSLKIIDNTDEVHIMWIGFST